MFTGKTSQSTTLKTVLLTISLVLAVALLVGSILFAVTMWRIRQRRRRHQSQLNTQHSKEAVVKTSKRCCCLCYCMCAKKKVRVRSISRTVREGPQLRTIEARDKKHGMIPLQFVSRTKDGRSHSEPILNNNKKRAVPAAKRGTDDLPYGYISPADINIPQYRNGKRHTVGEEVNLPVEDPIQPVTTSNHYMNIDFVGGVNQRVLRRDKSVDKPPSLSDSIYSIPCSLAASTDEMYDNAQHYLEILPP